MAILLVQHIDDADTATTDTLYLPGVAAGALIVVNMGGVSGRTWTCEDNVDGAYTEHPDGPIGIGDLFYRENSTGGDITITYTISGAGASIKGMAFEFAGIATSSALDQHGSNSTAAATSLASAAQTTTQADELLFSGITFDSVSAGLAPEAGYTIELPTHHAGYPTLAEYRVVSATGNYTGGFTWNFNRVAALHFVTFKGAAASGGGVIPVGWNSGMSGGMKALSGGMS
jgi:outer membrane protein assembly factor BamA